MALKVQVVSKGETRKNGRRRGEGRREEKGRRQDRGESGVKCVRVCLYACLHVNELYLWNYRETVDIDIHFKKYI